MKMSKNQTKKYMLFVFGEFKTEDDIIQELLAEFAGVIESNYMKFIFSPHSFIAHFSSKLSFEDLKIHTDQVLSFQVEQYFLTEIGTDFAVGMNPDLMEGLFDLDSLNEDKKHITMKTILGNMSSNGDNELMQFLKNLPEILNNVIDEDFMDVLSSQEKVVTLDDVLDKITEQGIENLTKQEKEILENYARGK